MSRKPCRYKACKGRTHRGPCPTAASIARQKRTHHTADHMKTLRAKQLTTVETNNLCGFCYAPAEDCSTGCKAAKTAAVSKGRIGRLAAAGQAARAAAAAAHEARLNSAVASRPSLNIMAIPNHPLACESCGLNATSARFSIAWADSIGWGICSKCNN